MVDSTVVGNEHPDEKVKPEKPIDYIKIGDTIMLNMSIKVY